MDNKGNKQWVWLALDVNTREIVGVCIGPRDEAAAQALRTGLTSGLPTVCSGLHRLLGSLCGCATPANARKAVGKETGLSSYIERFNNTLRQRVSRLLRKTLSFSKSLDGTYPTHWIWKITCELFAPYAPEENPVEAIWFQLKSWLRRFYRFGKNFKLINFLFQLFAKYNLFNFPNLKRFDAFSQFI